MQARLFPGSDKKLLRKTRGKVRKSSDFTCNCLMLILKSDSLNSYGIFHPKGPNFLLSWTNAWKKHRPNNIFSHSFGLSQPWKNCGSEIGSFMYDLIMFARNPFGGSFVILTPVRKIKWFSYKVSFAVRWHGSRRTFTKIPGHSQDPKYAVI